MGCSLSTRHARAASIVGVGGIPHILIGLLWTTKTTSFVIREIRVKIGDLIKFRMAYASKPLEIVEGVIVKWKVVQPRVDDEDWASPALVIGREAPPNEALWIVLYDGNPCVIDEENYEIQPL